MVFGVWRMGGELCSTQKFGLTVEYAEVCPKRFWRRTVQRAVGFAKLGGAKRGWGELGSRHMEQPTTKWTVEFKF